MATFLSPDHMTLSEALQLRRFNGSVSFVKELEKKSRIMRILPWYESSDGDHHKNAKATKLPKGDFGAINKPVPTGTAATTEYSESIGLYELKSDVDTRILEHMSREQAIRTREGRDRLYLMGFMQGLAEEIITCDGKKADSVKGILARRSKVDNKVCFSLGGSGANLGSILFLRPGEDGVNLRYPSNDAPNFTLKDMGIIQALATDSTGKITGQFPAYETLARVYYAIDIPDDYACIRVANVPTDTALTEANIDTLIDIVNDTLEDDGAGYVAFAPKQIISQFQKYLKDKSNINFSRREIEGMGKPVELLGIPFFSEEFMSSKEAAVA